MQCLIDLSTHKDILSPDKRIFARFLVFNALRFGFDDIITFARCDLPFLRETHRDLTPRALRIFDCGNDEFLSTGLAAALERGFFYLNAVRMPDFNWLDLAAAGMRGGEELMGLCINQEGAGASAYWLHKDQFLRRLHQEARVEPVDFLPSSTRAYQGRIFQTRDMASGFPERGAVFLDRDGVLNRDYGYVSNFSQWEWLPGARESIKAMNDAGYFVFVVTNQSGVARGYYAEEDVMALHAAIQEDLRRTGAHIDAFRYCPYHPEGIIPKYSCASDWRKPGTGMLENLCGLWPVDRSRSFMVGDSQSDVEAGRAFGLPSFRFQGEKLDLEAIRKSLTGISE